MFNGGVERKFELFVDNYFEVSDREFILKEEEDSGKAEISIQLSNPSIYIAKLDKKPKAAFLKSNKCVDHIIFEYKKDSNKWYLHVFEIKTSVGAKKWVESVKPQLKMGILNGLAIAGCLDLKIDEILCYTAYCNDKFYKDLSSEVKFRLGRSAENAMVVEWDSGHVKLKLGEERTFVHNKIKLNDSSGIPSATLNISA